MEKDILDMDGNPVQDVDGQSIKAGSYEEKLWFRLQDEAVQQAYIDRETKAGRDIEDEGMEVGASIARGLVTCLDGSVAIHNRTGSDIKIGSVSELEWIAEEMHMEDDGERALYLKKERMLGRKSVDMVFLPSDGKNEIVCDMDGDPIEDDAGNRVRKGSLEEIRYFCEDLTAEERLAYAEREAGIQRAERDKVVCDEEGKPIASPEGGFIFKDTEAERDWLSSLPDLEREHYLQREQDAGRSVDFEPTGSAGQAASPDSRPGTTRHDMSSYEEEVSKYDVREGFRCWTDNDGKTYHYEGGPLGDFEFDPKQFALTVVKVPGGEACGDTECMALKYIGTETNGRKIHVPEGIKDVSYMFYDTRITKAPQLPDSVEIAQMTYMNCPNLKDGSASLPANLSDGMFMFANCRNLVKGPASLPPSMEYASYMFADDTELKHPPRLNEGLKSANGAFAYCRNLTTVPKIPGDSRCEMRDMTVGCTALDEKKNEKEQKTFDKERARAQKKANGIGFFGHMASACAAAAQFHAMRQRGYNMVSAIYQVYKGRQNGTLGRNWSDVRANLTKDRYKRMNMLAKSKLTEQRRAQKAENKMREWDEMHGVGAKINASVKRLARSGASDFRNGLFERVNGMSAETRKGAAETYGGKEGIYDAYMETMTASWGDTPPTGKEKKAVVDFFMERVSENAAYYRAAHSAIEGGCRGEARREQMKGLNTFIRDVNEPMLKCMGELQASYAVFNENDKRRINSLLVGMGYKSENVFDQTTDYFKDLMATESRVQMESLDMGEIAQVVKEASAPQPEAAPAPQPEAAPAPQPEAAPAPQPEAAPAPQPEAAPAPQPEAAPAPQSENSSTQQPENNSAPQSGTNQDPQPESNSAQQPESNSAQQPEAAPAPKPEEAPAVPEEGKPVSVKDAFRRIGGALVYAGGEIAGGSGTIVSNLLSRVRQLVVDNVNTAPAPDDKPVEPEDKKDDIKIQPRGVTGGDVVDREDQVKLDEAVAKDRLIAAAEQRRLDADRLADQLRQAGGDKDKDGKDITD